MVIVVLSCDKNEDLWQPFHILIEKYYPNHPEIIYATETLKNPYYKTICKNYPLELWTKRIRETLNEINDNIILTMMDDDFIREPVDWKRIEYLKRQIKGNMGAIYFEKSFDKHDMETNIKGIKQRQHGSDYEVCINCGIWQKDKLLRIIERDSDPWDVELNQDNKGYDFYINSGEYIIDWGYRTYVYANICRGKWCREIVPFFEKEGIGISNRKRGGAVVARQAHNLQVG